MSSAITVREEFTIEPENTHWSKQTRNGIRATILRGEISEIGSQKSQNVIPQPIHCTSYTFGNDLYTGFSIAIGSVAKQTLHSWVDAAHSITARRSNGDTSAYWPMPAITGACRVVFYIFGTSPKTMPSRFSTDTTPRPPMQTGSFGLSVTPQESDWFVPRQLLREGINVNAVRNGGLENVHSIHYSGFTPSSEEHVYVAACSRAQPHVVKHKDTIYGAKSTIGGDFNSFRITSAMQQLYSDAVLAMICPPATSR